MEGWRDGEGGRQRVKERTLNYLKETCSWLTLCASTQTLSKEKEDRKTNNYYFIHWFGRSHIKQQPSGGGTLNEPNVPQWAGKDFDISTAAPWLWPDTGTSCIMCLWAPRGSEMIWIMNALFEQLVAAYVHSGHGRRRTAIWTKKK